MPAEEEALDAERHNLSQINRLNQRGGRTLSIIDLIEDGTVTAEMAAFCWLAVSGGTSFMTGAVPGGVGKTTLMAALLSFLPPGEPIVTVSDRRVIEGAAQARSDGPLTVLAHEIGAGRWFGYIWGRDAADYFALTRQGVRCVTCLHADSPEQSRASLSPLGVTADDFARVRLQLYMLAERRGPRVLRRVRSLHFGLDGPHQDCYRWQAADDRFSRDAAGEDLCALLAAQLGVPREGASRCWQRCEQWLQDWQSEGVRRFEDVRERIVAAYDGWPPGD